jgi:hypothetical protein
MCISLQHDGVGKLIPSTIYRLLEHSGLATNLARKNTRQSWRSVIFHSQGSNDVKENCHPDNYYLQFFHYELKKNYKNVTVQP